MLGGFFFSLVFHAAVTIVAYFGMPYLKSEPEITEAAIFVDVVDAAEKSNPSATKVRTRARRGQGARTATIATVAGTASSAATRAGVRALSQSLL